MLKILISCGEPSGDLYAGALTRALRELAPDARVFGMGGEHLRAAGGEVLADYRGLSVTGLSEAIAVLPKSFRTLRRLTNAARRERPDVFVPIDFPDFNFRLAARAKRLGIPIVYYISPQLWAWRPARLQTLKRLVDRILVIFPFEEPLYRDAGVPVEFVGHPLLDLVPSGLPREAFLQRHGLVADAPTIALLPGSRPNEVRPILPVLVSAAALIAARVPAAQFIVARAPNLGDRLFTVASQTGSALRPILVVEGATDEVLNAADVVITASGTATVQTAIHERPMVIVYRVSPLTYFVGRRFVTVDTYGMVNLVAGHRIAPELIQDALTPEAVAEAALRFLEDPAYAAATREELRRTKSRLGTGGASRRAAASILQVARGAGRPLRSRRKLR